MKLLTRTAFVFLTAFVLVTAAYAADSGTNIELISAPTVNGRAVSSADLTGLTEITVLVTVSADNPVSVTVSVPFFKGGKFLGMGFVTATVDNTTQSLTVPVTGNVSDAETLKVIFLDADFCPLYEQEYFANMHSTPTPVFYSDGEMTTDSSGLNWIYHSLPYNYPNVPTVLSALSSSLSTTYGFYISPGDFTNTNMSGNVITTDFAGSTYRITLANDALEMCVVVDDTSSEATIAVTKNNGIFFHSNETVNFVIQSGGATVSASAVASVTYTYTAVDHSLIVKTVTPPSDVAATGWTFTLPRVADRSNVFISVDLV